MDSSNSDHLGVLVLSVACFAPVLPAAWKAASLRGDIFNKWSERVDLAHAGLNERATSELLELQAQISEIVGGTGEGAFTPAEVWLDPDPFIDRANRCATLLRARDKLRGRFRRHRQLGPTMIPLIVVYVAGWLLATLFFTEVIHHPWEKILGFVLGGVAAAGALIVFALYAYYEAKLTAAEEMAAGDRG
jgi:hypothetical protein